MKTGFSEVDDIIACDAITVFFSSDYNLLSSFYHKVIVESRRSIFISRRTGRFKPL